MNESVLIVGAGLGLSASLARLCSSKNMKVVLAARNIEKLQSLKEERSGAPDKRAPLSFSSIFFCFLLSRFSLSYLSFFSSFLSFSLTFGLVVFSLLMTIFSFFLFIFFCYFFHPT